MSKQTQKITPGDAFTPEESRTGSKLLLGYGRVSNVRTSSSNATIGGGGGGGAGGGGGSGTVITISTAKGEDWKMHYPIHEPCLSFGSRVRVFGRVVNGWVSSGRVEITVDEGEAVDKEVRIREIIPLKAYSEVVGINTSHPTGTTTTAAAAATMGVLVCVKSQTPRATTTTTGNPIPSLRIQILDATAEGTLTLWGPTATAATSAGWTPFSTALYITAARVSTFNGSVQISLTQSSTLFALPILSSSSSSLTGTATSLLHQHLLKTYPHTRLQLPPLVCPVVGVKLLFTLAEFSAHVSSKVKAQKKRVLGGEGVGVVVSGYLSLILIGVNLVLLFKRNMLFLGSCSNGKYSYTSTPNTYVCTCTTSTTTTINNQQKCILTWSPNPSILQTLTDETGTIPGTALIFSQKAWDSLLLLTLPELANKSLQELVKLESRLAYTRFEFAVVWDSKVGVLYVCDASQ